MAFVRVNDVVLHARAGRDTATRPLVFVNSLGTDYRIWHGVAHRLREQDFRFLFYDKRGHGLSEVGGVPCAMEDHVNDLAALMDHYGMKEAIVCGISVGGMIALGLSAARPDLVAALVLCDTAHRIGTRESWNARIAQVAKGGIASVWPMIERAWFTEDYRRDFAAEVAGWRAMVTRCPVGGYVGACMAIAGTDYTAEAQGVRVPTRVLCGAEDGSTPPEVVRAMADLIPGADYIEIERAAHMICIEQPERTAELIAGFAHEQGLA